LLLAAVGLEGFVLAQGFLLLPERITPLLLAVAALSQRGLEQPAQVVVILCLVPLPLLAAAQVVSTGIPMELLEQMAVLAAAVVILNQAAQAAAALAIRQAHRHHREATAGLDQNRDQAVAAALRLLVAQVAQMAVTAALALHLAFLDHPQLMQAAVAVVAKSALLGQAVLEAQAAVVLVQRALRILLPLQEQPTRAVVAVVVKIPTKRQQQAAPAS
jgi:hypothetical protein